MSLIIYPFAAFTSRKGNQSIGNFENVDEIYLVLFGSTLRSDTVRDS